jgi:hypothetical protein
MAYPIDGKNTFRPSGNPAIDPPERPRISELEWTRSVLGLDTLEGVKEFDRVAGPLISFSGWFAVSRAKRVLIGPASVLWS